MRDLLLHRLGWGMLAAMGTGLCPLHAAQAEHIDVAETGEHWHLDVGATPFDASDAIDIRQFCDGSEADAAACIGEWMATAETQGRHLLAPEGTYVFSGELTAFDGMHLRCGSHDVVFRRADGGERIFAGTGVSDVSIEGCGFDMYGEPARVNAALSLTDADHVTFRQNRVFDSGGRPCDDGNCRRDYVSVRASTDVLIDDNELRDGGGMRLGRPGHRYVVTNNLIAGVNNIGIDVSVHRTSTWPDGSNDSSDMLIDGNSIAAVSRTGIYFGLAWEGTDPAISVRGMTIINNTVIGNAGRCINGKLPEDSAAIFVGNNRCEVRPPTSGWHIGIRLAREGTTRPTEHFLTAYGNFVGRGGAGIFKNNAFFVDYVMGCFVDNEVRNNNGAIRVRHESTVLLHGNDWGDGVEPRVDDYFNSSKQEVDRNALSPCFVPDIITTPLF